ncbi:hypothetical protein HNQ64_002821 [Prosthecobacter dejongeii]|uniref:Uncharacterized protein n=1 Tax=Prosthecobacter dejongeii TaxID=48465 RepID=A0A7W7YLS1_9BACT|nr:hypothetical protein [Prosthecobacter dejongeii]
MQGAVVATVTVPAGGREAALTDTSMTGNMSMLTT